MRRPSAELVHCSWKGQERQVRTLKVMTIASAPCCFTGFQCALLFPAGQRTWRAFQSMAKAFLSKPVCALAWAEWSSRTGVTIRVPRFIAAVMRSAEG
ncbi:hypothetical protein [Streptomyces sasae]|uniref:hypothetical protein n=1 Tax=Streptomyces sasae TaxID=1266772 RepID=UPI00292F474E|nr:hypothetical protein [Streptomyces sasae]